MNTQTDSDCVNIKKIRPVPGTGNVVDQISIEDALQHIFRNAREVDCLIGLAAEAAATDKMNLHYDRSDAVRLMLKHANETITDIWCLTDDLAKALAIDVHAKPSAEESEGETL